MSIATEPLAPDAEVRSEVLDPARSFVLRAPAGSGKTELLVRRVLRLLAVVARPEQILAITFTRKAAGEMRERLRLALLEAQAAPPTQEAAADSRLGLARQVLQRDRACGWQLLEQPSRLQLHTLDAFCGGLARRDPLQAGAAALLRPTEDAQLLFREAARRCLQSGPREAWGRLLDHLDNRADKAIALIADMLSRREQWEGVLFPRHHREGLREALEAALEATVVAALAAARQLMQALDQASLVAIARHASAHAPAKAPQLKELIDFAGLPPAARAALPKWQALAHLLLIADGGARKRVDVNCGFPPADAAAGEERQARAAAKALAERVTASLSPLAAAALDAVRRLPVGAYTDAAWPVVEAALHLLKQAAAELRGLMSERGECDFATLGLAALEVLGHEEAPSDLLLTLDERIQHVLVDEFQDTSHLQVELLRRLTAGWSEGDGRTLFLVGDGMQSIYRFRNAEVQLFRQASEHGLGSVACATRDLRANFRSSPALVDWVNQVFSRLALAGDELEDAGLFVPAIAARGAAGEGGAAWHRCADRDAEAQAVVELIIAARAAKPQGSIAILVRARSHLAAIVPALKGAGIRFHAVDVEPLGDLPVVMDLLALTRLLLFPADRLAWMSLLHAPCCGLALADLTRLDWAMAGKPWTLPLLREAASSLEAEGGQRLARALEVLEAVGSKRGESSLASCVEAAWLALGGPAVVEPEELAAARRYLDTLAASERAADIEDWPQFVRRVDELFAEPPAMADEAVQIMTIHKSKGLEFDTVIIPSLDRPGRRTSRPLLRWRVDAAQRFLMAPDRAQGGDKDRVYEMLQAEESARAEAELLRLAYVAFTRARTALHLLCVRQEDAPGRAPRKSSLLALLWPAVSTVVDALAVGSPQAKREAAWEMPNSSLRTIAPDARAPHFREAESLAASAPSFVPQALNPPFDWAQEEARLIGVVTHRLLQRIGEEGAEAWPEARLASLRPAARALLAREGCQAERREDAAEECVLAIGRMLADERGRWILSQERASARSEWQVSGMIEGQIVNAIIDRSFIEAGARWIIDYKTGSHLGADREAFIEREAERYAPQLLRYARLVGALEGLPVRLGLYFPRLQEWREI